jgi:DNA-binding NarL/FixJ family response regulator
MTYKVIIADDHPVILSGLKSLINDFEGFEVVCACVNGLEALQSVRQRQPDILILDFDMPKMNGLEVAEVVKNEFPNVAISILTLHKEEAFFNRAIDLGVEGFLLKDFASSEIEKCLRTLAKGDKFYSDELKALILSESKLPTNFSTLSRMERKVIRLISENKTSREIADLLFISPKTVQNHRYNISKKLELEPKNNSLLTWANKFSKSL